MLLPARCLFLLTALFIGGAVGLAAQSSPPSAGALQHDLKTFGEVGSVLYVAAHPDDENTQLITYLACGRGYRTAYLSITRGDGGQNELGPEFGEKLGVARTQELLAARQLDGGQQFFTRALDYGFSKDYREALATWDHQQVLADVVRVIRTFQPDVIITRFSPEPSNTHGHHTASAVLAVEAFKLSGDPKAFPEQLTTLRPWQAKRILQNGGGPNGRGRTANAGALSIEIGGDDPVTGESFASIAGRSRAMHKTQGFGNFGSGVGGPRQESFTLLGGDAATKDILDGVDNSWSRFPGGAEISRAVNSTVEHFDSAHPAASVPNLLAIRKQVAALPQNPVVAAKQRQLDHLLTEFLGLSAETTVPSAEVVPGEMVPVHNLATITSDFPVHWIGTRYPAISVEKKFDVALTPSVPTDRPGDITISKTAVPTQPYWLRDPSTTGMFVVKTPELIGQAENPPTFPVEQIFQVGDQKLILSGQPVQPIAAATKAQAERPLAVIPPASLRFISEVELFAPSAQKKVEVEISAARPGVQGTVALHVPAGWKSSPAKQLFQLAAAGASTRVVFEVTAPNAVTSADVTADAEINGEHFDEQRIVVNYPHLPLELLQPTARLRVVALNFAIHGHRVGYVPGAGDSLAEDLKQMGYEVSILQLADFTAEKLAAFDAIVIGVRAANENRDFAKHTKDFYAYVENGGTLIAQYNRPNGLKTADLGPYQLSILGDPPKYRVTDETAPVTFLQPDNAVLQTPNKIGPDDFKGWVQERGTYFPSSWDKDHYAAVLAMSDPGEPPLEGSLLVARYGKGYFVYTGLTFFRQLPAGVPGAFRLFANLTSLGR